MKIREILPGAQAAVGELRVSADVRAFAVDARAQGQGVGRQLLRAVIGYAASRGVRRLRLCTQPAMTTARHLYETTGFARTPELDFEPVPGLMLRAYELSLAPARDPGPGSRAGHRARLTGRAG